MHVDIDMDFEDDNKSVSEVATSGKNMSNSFLISHIMVSNILKKHEAIVEKELESLGDVEAIANKEKRFDVVFEKEKKLLRSKLFWQGFRKFSKIFTMTLFIQAIFFYLLSIFLGVSLFDRYANNASSATLVIIFISIFTFDVFWFFSHMNDKLMSFENNVKLNMLCKLSENKVSFILLKSLGFDFSKDVNQQQDKVDFILVSLIEYLDNFPKETKEVDSLKKDLNLLIDFLIDSRDKKGNMSKENVLNFNHSLSKAMKAFESIFNDVFDKQCEQKDGDLFMIKESILQKKNLGYNEERAKSRLSEKERLRQEFINSVKSSDSKLKLNEGVLNRVADDAV